MSINPTERQDYINSQLPLSDQFPERLPQVRTIDTDPAEDLQLYPSDLDTAYTVIRCRIANHPNLRDAQRYFGEAREQLRWRSEGAIFRTAVWWVKRVML